MGTNIRNNISRSNPYYIPKHEYLMTRHFAMQYNDWKKAKREIESRIGYGYHVGDVHGTDIHDPVFDAQMKTEGYLNKMELIEQTAKIAGEELWEFVLLGATTECSYEYLRLVKSIPCCKDSYYRMYRKFFWLLNHQICNLLNGKPNNFKEE